ncbi:MAG TPA: sigma-54 dependent transcriptional regulator [Vicinamibacterales bacterium]|nr:sigma-54 dependent transcriptional regulator [Vicinamibacterales bacterium]
MRDDEDLIGTSPAIRDLRDEIAYAGRSDAKVLITGESGVGKEVLARLVHRHSNRARAQLVTINCAGLPDSLLESELFGHVRGSFTGAYRDKAGLLELANNGTIFMDEIGEMTLRMQALLLRFLESGEIQRVGAERPQARVNVRVIAATNRNLIERIASKDFREDLYYRVNVIHLTVPPLRDRRDDIPPLLQHFVEYFSRRHGLAVPRLSDEAHGALVAYRWPGNVRELKNFVERLVLRARAGFIGLADLPLEISPPPMARPLMAGPPARAEAVDRMFERMTRGHESFWTVVYEPFMSRDMTRDDLRALISRGLEQTRGSYRILVQLFNMPEADYKRFLNFLRKHDCQMPFQRFRSLPAKLDADRFDEEAALTGTGPNDGAETV